MFVPQPDFPLSIGLVADTTSMHVDVMVVALLWYVFGFLLPLIMQSLRLSVLAGPLWRVLCS